MYGEPNKVTTEFVYAVDFEQPLLSVAMLQFVNTDRFDTSTEYNILDPVPICPLAVSSLVASKAATGNYSPYESIGGLALARRRARPVLKEKNR